MEEDDAAIWEQVRSEVHVLERELRELQREAEQKQAAVRELQGEKQRQLQPSALVHSSGSAETLSRLMEELRAVQHGVRAESERHLELSAAIDHNNTELYRVSTHNHTVRNEREAAASQLAALAQEQEMLSSQLQELRRKEQEGEEQLAKYAQMQEAATGRLHEAQRQELASHVKDVALELAELEGLRSLVPILDQQAEEAAETVHRKNQLLQEQVMERRRLEQQVEELYGPDALGTGGARTAPYAAEMLNTLLREYTAVQQLRQEVIDADSACTNEVRAIEQEIVAVRNETSHINVEKGALLRQLEQGTAKILQLQQRVDDLNSAVHATVQRADEHRQNLLRGDEIIAQRLQAMEQRLRDKKALRSHAREEMEKIAERHRQLQAKQIEEMRANIRQQEADLLRQLQQNGFAQGVLEDSPTAVRRVAADAVRQTAMMPRQAPQYSPTRAPLRDGGYATGGAAAASGAAYMSGLASPPPGRGPLSSVMLHTGHPTMGSSGGRGSASFAPPRGREQVAAPPGSIAEMVRTGNEDPTLKAAAQKAAQRLLAQGQRR